MKRIVCLMLALGLLLSFAACAKTEKSATPAQKLVPTPMTWANIEAIPIANDQMTEDELRQICVDFSGCSCSFSGHPRKTWTLKSPVTSGIPTFPQVSFTQDSPICVPVPAVWLAICIS